MDQWRSLQDYSINWITSLLSFAARQQGEEAVERALREFGDEFLPGRTNPEWDTLPAETRARAITQAMLANFGTVEVAEDDEKITLEFRCGTGGRLIDGRPPNTVEYPPEGAGEPCVHHVYKDTTAIPDVVYARIRLR